MAKQAILCDDLDTFHKRFELTANTSTNQFVNKITLLQASRLEVIEASKENIKSFETLTKKDIKKIEKELKKDKDLQKNLSDLNKTII